GLAERIKHELLELLPPTVFFLIAFHLITVSRALMLRRYGIQVSAMAGATIGALLVAKVVLLADLLPAINRSPEKPLIYCAIREIVRAIANKTASHPKTSPPSFDGHAFAAWPTSAGRQQQVGFVKDMRSAHREAADNQRAQRQAAGGDSEGPRGGRLQVLHHV